MALVHCHLIADGSVPPGGATEAGGMVLPANEEDLP